jgi:hypothetical protein
VYVNVTLSLDERLVKEIRKIAVERDTTLNGLIREYLERLAKENSEQRRERRLAALEKSFEAVEFRVGRRTWTRADLHERS